MSGERSSRWRIAAVLLSCVPALLAPGGKAAADTAWTRRAGAWSVSLYLGERGDAWCGWTTMWTDATGGLGRSLSLQMRGAEAILFLFLEGAGTNALSPRSELALSIDGLREVALADLVRSLPNGFLMARGVLAADAGDRVRLVARLAAASSIELTMPGGGTWPIPATGLAQTAPALGRCLAEMEAPGPPR